MQNWKDEEGNPNVEKLKESTVPSTATEKEKSASVSVRSCANCPGPSQENSWKNCKYMSEKEKDKDAKSESDEAFTPMEDKTKVSSIMYL